MTNKIVVAKVEQIKPLEVPNKGWNLSYEIIAREINCFESIYKGSSHKTSTSLCLSLSSSTGYAKLINTPV